MKTQEAIRARDEKIEAQLPEYTLPQVLVNNNGERVTSEVMWDARRKEIVALFEEHLYGRNPEYTGGIEPRIAKEEHHKPEGHTEKTVHIRLDGGVTLCVAMQYPDDGKRHSFFVSEGSLAAGNRDVIIPAGYGYASVDCVGARDRWRDDIINTIFKGEPQDVRAELSVIGAWAWALSRAVDYFKTFEKATVGKVGTIGHSRGGKIALWASVLDERFSMTFPNDSGKGGVALWKREVGESVADMCRRWPRWLNPKARAYINNEKSLPVDQHMLVAALAPRPVHVAVATDDPGSDPRGEFEALREGGVSYELLTGTGFGLLDWPEPESPHIGLMSFHRRIGGHDLLPYDFSQFVTSANRMT